MTAAARSETNRARATLATAPAPSGSTIDRRHQVWVPLYLEFLRHGRDRNGRLGYGLDPGPAALLCIIIHRQGMPADGRRESKGERDGTERFRPHNLSAGELVRDFGFSYDQIESWGRRLQEHHPCPYCDRAHRVLTITQSRGRPNRYRLMRCNEVSDKECIPVAEAMPEKRKKTGGRVMPDDGSEPFAFLTGRVDVAEPSGKLRQFGGGDEPPRPTSDTGKRRLALDAIALLEDVDAPADVLDAIASGVDTSDVALLRDTLLRVVATASIRRVAMTPGTVAEIVDDPDEVSEKVRRSSPPVSVAEGDTTTRWARERLLELMKRREPWTTQGQAAQLYDEVHGRILARVGDDPVAIEREMQRILTDPRICGRIDEPTKNPIALLRASLADGWIWRPYEEDDGTGKLERAFRKLAPGVQSQITLIFERHRQAGEPLPYKQLEALGITSKPMISYLTKRGT